MTAPHTPAEAVQYWYDAATERREERDRLRAVVARIRQMVDYWEQRLPETIRTPAVVSALRAALDRASAVPLPPSVPSAPDAIASAVLAVVEAAGGDTLTPDARAEALAGIAAVLPATTRHDTDERIEQAEADAELHARNTETVARERESYRAAWKDEQRRRAEAEAELKRLRCMVDEYGDGAGALTRKLKRVRDLHRETCPSGLSCGMCELLDAPADPLRRVADETTATETQAVAPVQHTPGKAIRCSDCRAKGYTVCLPEPAAGARQDGASS
ncbi:hypothetical protein [Streptomyces olivaceus]|uniref:hypothetical protein n=1 Tax=Streptomyces olivaceus TaxID=47716 RepID=UPI0036A2FCF9